MSQGFRARYVLTIEYDVDVQGTPMLPGKWLSESVYQADGWALADHLEAVSPFTNPEVKFIAFQLLPADEEWNPRPLPRSSTRRTRRRSARRRSTEPGGCSGSPLAACKRPGGLLKLPGAS